MKMTPLQKKAINDLPYAVNKLEVEFSSELRKFFLTLEPSLQEQITEAPNYNEIQNIINDHWNTYETILEKYISRSYNLGQKFIQLYNGNKNVTIKSFKLPVDIQWFITSTARVSSEYVRKRYGIRVVELIQQAFYDGDGISTAQSYLRKYNKSFTDYEAHRIARTEIKSIMNQSSMDTIRENGTQYKQWFTMQDDRVRGNDPKDNADHTEMEGEIAPIDQPFSNGLMYPGDKNGDITEWINCRCSVLPYTIPWNMAAPTDMETFHESDLIMIDNRSAYQYRQDIMERFRNR